MGDLIRFFATFTTGGIVIGLVFSLLNGLTSEASGAPIENLWLPFAVGIVAGIVATAIRMGQMSMTQDN